MTYLKATFGGGCFWCMEQPFEDIAGVQSVKPGYMGGHIENPTYEIVCSGGSGHVEVVQIEYDESVSYEDLLEKFWMNIDPTDGGGQFADRGTQYRPVIFYHSEKQRELAERSKLDLIQKGIFDEELSVKIEGAHTFYQAENYHCQYHRKNPERYAIYKKMSGRSDFIHRYWKKTEE